MCERADSGDLTPKQLMARELHTRKRAKTYAKRKWMFGQIKACPSFRQFLLQGLTNIQGESGLVRLIYNLLKAFRAKHI